MHIKENKGNFPTFQRQTSFSEPERQNRNQKAPARREVRPLVSTADAEGPAEAFGTRKPPNKEVSNGAPGKVQQKETI